MCPSEVPKAASTPHSTLPRLSRKVLKQLRDSLPKSVIPVLLTILGTVAFQSLMSVVHFFSEVPQMRQQAEYERMRDVALLNNEEMVVKAVAAFDYGDHLTLVNNFQKSFQRMNNEERQRFGKQLTTAADQTENQLGTLEGYVGLESTLPESWIKSQIQVYSAELELLETAQGCAEYPLHTDVAKRDCLISMNTHRTRLERALSRNMSTAKVLEANKPLIETERKLRWDRASHGIDMLFLKLFAALMGLSICYWAYGKLFSHFLETEKT
jgi:hypothetical protein